MIRFPNAKINLGLNILRRRADGYHDLDTVFYPIPLCDALEIVPARNPDNGTTLTLSGNPVDCPAEKNLIMKAYRLLEAEFELPPVEIYLRKHIPDGAGLGGGSADAAFTLSMLRDLFTLPLDDDALRQRAARLGADCAFFIGNRPAKASGIGDILTDIPLSLAGMAMVVAKPDVYVSTKDAYAGVAPRIPEIAASEAVALPIERWASTLVNDFEPSVFGKFPEIAAVKRSLIESGAEYASMSGSGSSVFGIFTTIEAAENAAGKLEKCAVFTFTLE